MKGIRLRTKILLSVGVIIFVVLGTSTLIHIHDLRQDYLEALTWRSEALAQDIINEITKMQSLGLHRIRDMFPPLALRCIKLYALNKDKNVTHFAVIDETGTIGPHNNDALWHTPVQSPILREYLQHQKQMTILDGDLFHTLVPVFGASKAYLATVDIGVPKSVVDEKTQRVLLQSIVLFVVFLFLAFMMISFLMHVLLTKPVQNLVFLGQQLAAGNLVDIPEPPEQGDEITILTSAFHRISVYFCNVAEVATTISTGDLRRHILPRSQQDVLGMAFQRMTAYLDRLANAATSIASGNLQQEVQPESAHDVLGNAFQTMAVQLRENFEKIQQEVAERTRAQEALQQLNAELEQRVEERTAELAREKYILDTFMDTVPDKIYFKDCDGRITRANKAHAASYGFADPDEEIGKTDFDLLPAALAQMTLDQEQNILRSGEPILDRELPIPQQDSSVRWALITKMPLRDEHGQLIGTFGISRDITSQKQAQASLEQAYLEILSLNRQLQEDTLRYSMKALLLGTPSVTSPASIPATVQETWNAPCFCVVLIKLLPADPVMPSAIKSGISAKNMLFSLTRLYEDYTREIPLAGIFIHLTDTEAGLILNFDDETQVRSLCTYLVSRSTSVLEECHYRLAVGIGNIVNAPEDLHSSYDKAQQSLLTRQNSGTVQLLFAADAEQHKRDALIYYFPFEKEQQLMTAVIAGQSSQVHYLLQEILEQNALEQSSYQKLLALYHHFLQTVGKILAQSPVQDMSISESPLLQTFRVAKPETIQEFQERLNEVFRQLLMLYARDRQQQADALTKKLFRYLERHYANPNISLDSLAEAFNLNSSYLSRYFKEQTGMNYVEYLAMLRIKIAKNLLLAQPQEKIDEVGIQVGFSGKATFIRTFKRLEGVTPGTYRKRALSNVEV
ncbi:putative signal transduction histidine kinase [Candidatus Vecturithrix granuli]|uniref:Putative signal transduction histidine kinase n=1 Tax=Vecturithrix granuli TaxID=1499967 RepID=A0A081C172_VECG1|nr:putative signal transduction histidine kinase [Candidatus Vecturithrix granuli]